MSVSLHEGIYWVGAVDWNLRDFHGYITGRGATYNAYLIDDDKTALVDTVKEPFFDEMLARISRVCDPASIEYLICNHIEKDHSSSLPRFVHRFPNVKILASPMAVKGLKKYYGDALPLEAVKSGDTLQLGRKTLQFLETPMVHWPDSMFTYVPQSRLLFSMDGFGQHLATFGRFDDEVDEGELFFELRKYYANLLTHLAPLIQTTLKKVSELKLEIDIVAPSHGVIWRKHISRVLQLYDEWSSHVSREKAVIVYDTMWKSTERMAKILFDAIADAGVEVSLRKLRENHRSDIMAELLDARGLLLGSPTIHRQLFPTVADLLCYMKGLKPQKKTAAAFGSYGWSGEAVQLVTDDLKAIGLDVIEPGVRAVYSPDDRETGELQQLAGTVVKKIRQ